MSDFDKWLMKNNDKDQCADWSVVRKAWNHQQQKIDAVLKIVNDEDLFYEIKCEMIQELLK